MTQEEAQKLMDFENNGGTLYLKNFETDDFFGDIKICDLSVSENKKQIIGVTDTDNFRVCCCIQIMDFDLDRFELYQKASI